MNNSEKNQSQKPRGLDWAFISALIGLFGLAIFFMGQFSTNKETNDKVDKMIARLDGLNVEIKKAKEDAKAALEEVASQGNYSIVFMNGKLGSGLKWGLYTSGGMTNWVSFSDNIIIKYPGQQSWGAVWITVGETMPPPRPTRDYSKFSKLLIEMKGEIGGETVLIGIKDCDDPDDGSESKTRLNLIKDWRTYELKLTDFSTADLKKLNSVTEFAFETKPQTIFVRKIQFN